MHLLFSGFFISIFHNLLVCYCCFCCWFLLNFCLRRHRLAPPRSVFSSVLSVLHNNVDCQRPHNSASLARHTCGCTQILSHTPTNTHAHLHSLHLRRLLSNVCPCQLQPAAPAGYLSLFPSDDSRPNEPQSVNVTARENKKGNIYLKLINHFNARSLRGFMTPEVCTHWHPRTLLFYSLELIIYATASGNYSHPQKLFTSNSQLQLNSEALSFFAYKPRFVSLSCFSLASLFFFISQIDSNSARCINFLLSASDSTYPYDQGGEGCRGGGEALSGVGVAFIVCHAHAEQARQGRPTSNLAVAKTKVNICLPCVCECVCAPNCCHPSQCAAPSFTLCRAISF